MLYYYALYCREGQAPPLRFNTIISKHIHVLRHRLFGTHFVVSVTFAGSTFCVMSSQALSVPFAASKDGSLQEIFASGTAAVISPIGCLNYKGTDYKVADEKVGPVAQKLYDTIYGMQTGKVEDDMGWTYKLFDLK